MIRVGSKYQHLIRARGCACCAPALRDFTQRMGVDLSRRGVLAGIAAAAASLGLTSLASDARAQAPQPGGVLFENVRIFDGSERLTPPSNVLVVGNRIRTIATGPITLPDGLAITRVAGGGRTLMPGLIDAHTHMMFETVPQIAILTTDIGYVNVAAVKAANDALMRGFTSIRDLGGPIFGLKRGIDQGLVAGPRIWPSGAFISQSGGHGDFRVPNDLPAQPGQYTYTERVGGAAIADSPDMVRQRAREQLALGASQIKLMAGGGVASSFDPLDVTQYTVPELRAGVEAAENWGTYATVHAYTPRAVRQSIEAGVRCIEHGQLLDDPTVALMAEKGLWWSLQPFIDDRPSAFREGSPNRIKQLEMFGGTDIAYGLAKKHGIKTAWGTDILFSADVAATRGAQLTKMVRWYSPAAVLRMATADNAALLALSGNRSPYPGTIGVVREGALADLLLVDGDPLANIQLIEDPAKSFMVIAKDGRLHKNLLA
jgi:imidazolonepropionase-like amidohydrolase